MKRLILFSILILASGVKSYGQKISQHALSSGGGEFTTSSLENVQFTVGQPFVSNTLVNGSNTFITQGYQQPYYTNEEASSFDFHESALINFEVYPNPAVDYAELELNLIDTDGAKVDILDMWGRVIKTQQFNVDKGLQKLHFNFGSLAEGVYTVKVNANNRVYAKKLLVHALGGSNIL